MAAHDSGLSPYMKILGVNGRQFSHDELTRAIQNTKSGVCPHHRTASNGGVLETTNSTITAGRPIHTWSACNPFMTIWTTF